MPKLPTNFEQEKQCGRTHIPWFQHDHKVTVNTTVWYCHKDKIINQWKRIQSPAKPSHIWSNDFWQSCKIIQCGKDSFPQNGAGRTWHPYAKEWGSVQLSQSVVSDSSRPRGLQHARPSHSSPTSGVYSNSCPLRWWCHPTVSSSVDPFSSHLQSFPASGSFQMRQLFTWGGQSIGVSASASVLPPNIQNWFL